MDSWGQGYVTDLEYTAGFYAEQSPAILRLACLLNGIDTPPIDDGFTYCELGCGVGVTALILAASNPRGRFVAVDFHPVHILKARSVAHAAGLTNIEFLEHSFEQLADGGSAALPPLDFITLHGVYSWVSHETRRQIVSIMARHLKPGGLAYVSYNAMPGSAQRQPVQRLLWDLAALTPSRSDQRIARAIEQLDALKTAGARALAGNEFASDAMKQLKHGAEQYLAHEYLNEHWNPMYHADLARELAAAKLTYAGSANLIENFAEVMLDAEQREFLNSLGAPHLRETLRDFCTNKTFRKDVFVRGAHQLSASRQLAQLSQIKLALLVPREEFKFEIEAPAGKGDLNRAVYGAVVDALAEGPRTVAELVSLPTMPGSHQMSPLELVGILVGTRQAAPVVDGVAPVDQAAADRLTMALSDLFAEARPSTAVGVGVAALGGGLRIGMIEFAVHRSMLMHGAVDTDAVAAGVYDSTAARGASVLKDGKPIEGREESLAFLRDRVREITERMRPLWHQFWPQSRGM